MDLSTLERLYGEYVICKCDQREQFLRHYYDSKNVQYGSKKASIENQSPRCPVFIDCRSCQWDRFRNDPGVTFRIDMH